MARVVLTMTYEVPVGPDSWFCTEEDLAQMDDDGLLELFLDDIGRVDGATYKVERRA